MLAGLVGKLYLPDDVDELRIKSLVVLLRNVVSVSFSACGISASYN